MLCRSLCIMSLQLHMNLHLPQSKQVIDFKICLPLHFLNPELNFDCDVRSSPFPLSDSWAVFLSERRRVPCCHQSLLSWLCFWLVGLAPLPAPHWLNHCGFALSPRATFGKIYDSPLTYPLSLGVLGPYHFSINLKASLLKSRKSPSGRKSILTILSYFH